MGGLRWNQMKKIISGIYKITNLINEKVYIGQSVNIYQRWHDHCYKEYNRHLSSAFAAYGIDNFTFEILEETLIEDLTKREEYYIQVYDARNPVKGYNCKEAGTHGRHSLETRRRISESHKGKKMSDEARHSMSEARKGNTNHKGKPHTDKTKQKIRDSLKNNKQISIRRNVYKIVDTDVVEKKYVFEKDLDSFLRDNKEWTTTYPNEIRVAKEKERMKRYLAQRRKDAS